MNFERKPNIVLLVLDTLRAKNVSCYGHERESTANLDSLASEGILCRNAQTVSPWTLPAHSSLFTGRYPSEHGADARTKMLGERYPTVAERLGGEGYTTVGVSNNLWLSPEFGTTRGFENFHLMWQYFDTKDVAAPLAGHDPRSTLKVLRNVFGGNPLKRLVNLFYGYIYRRDRRRAGKTNRKVLEEAEASEEPVFLFANYMENHLPYRPPREHAEDFLPEDASFEEAMEIPQDSWDYVFGDEPMDERIDILQDLYDAAASYLDSCIGELVGELEEKLDGPTLFVIVSDHGENIGEHGLMNHMSSLENTVLKVPMILYGDGVEGQVVEENVDLTDLHATILEAAGLEPEGHGTPVLEVGEGARTYAQYLELMPPLEKLNRKYGVTLADLDGREEMEAVVEGGKKLIRFSDRTECRENSYGEEAVGGGEELESALEKWRNSLDESQEAEERELAENVKKRLEDLGYY